jgi:nitrate/nitrite transporter NarK
MLVGVSAILVVPLIDRLWIIVLILAFVRSLGLAGSALNFALVTDLVRNRADVGKVTAITVVGGNTFGLMAPIATGYIIALTGSFDRAFVVAGLLPLVGAAVTLIMTRKPIEPRAAQALL